ncbi:AfsA-related hotdog domain-containing protein [Streptomyces alanosinicus]|uniref:Adhesin n=1 Tax=Streptomyces alanosinicus TaxID=68171 RepID=A0A918YRQ2_9ACTN|nr:AfsA-related hotdog domain-containing protein [Streptomyces alanosinicus]GHE12675.1 adhesin [Streptomyces alanosinicus]
MTVLPLRPAAPETDLTTQRTLARRLVHRSALAEVFLTDFRSVDELTFHAAAQLPPRHFYYSDHTTRVAMHDPLAVFEAVRQMLLCAMHLQHDAGPDTKSITATASLEITDPEPLRRSGALDLTLLGGVLLEKKYEGATSRVVHRVRVLVDGRETGVITVDTAQRPNDVYEKLRHSHRTTPPPMSDTLPATGAGALPPVWLVGRERAENVVVQDARTEDGALVTELRVPAAHPSMFDHAQDHVPGPVMMEAARQASLLLAADHQGLSPSSFHLDYVSAEYLRFAELDSPIAVVTRLMPNPVSEGQWTEVSFEQDGAAVARMRVRLGSALASGGDDAV